MLATAKIHILKQFTTQHRGVRRRNYCACYCKDTHFEAIHNLVRPSYSAHSIVLATAKIHILKQFTTRTRFLSRAKDCACYCKDTHFEAIHNTTLSSLTTWGIVLATAKIHILKQFTTRRVSGGCRGNCACYCKDTHFEAIHNPEAGVLFYQLIVLATAKIHILKQFTTSNRRGFDDGSLCLLLQRYTF